MATIPEAFAARILTTAVRQEKAAELLECLFGGGSVTVVGDDLVLLSPQDVDTLANGGVQRRYESGIISSEPTPTTEEPTP